MSVRFAPAKASPHADKAPAHRVSARGQEPAPYGNQALLRRLSGAAPVVQPKLEIGSVDDPLEHEADRVADSVLHMPRPAGGLTQAPPTISRKCAGCDEEDKLQAQLADTPRAADSAPDITASPVKVSRDGDPDLVPADGKEIKNDWTPPAPPTAPGKENQVRAVDPRVFHDGWPTKFPGNPSPPTGWKYWDPAKHGLPPPRGIELANEGTRRATLAGTFIQEIVSGQLIGMRCEWHDRHEGETAPSGLYHAGNLMLPLATAKFVVQHKLAVSTPGDPLEQEADRMAETVMRMANGEPHEGEQAPRPRSGQAGAAGSAAPPSATAVLGAGGEPMAPSLRAYFEPRFGRDFSQVRLHTDGAAADAARSIQARAFASGGDIVFAAGEYAPETAQGRRLLAHELTHVVQQGAAASSNSAEAGRAGNAPGTASTVKRDVSTGVVARQPAGQPADPLSKGTTPGSGVQFWPTQLTGTYNGPVSRVGGLAGNPNRLSVIIGQKLTLNTLAQLILPLWNSAAPITPDGATAPVVSADLTADQLARALLAYNQTYLKVLSQPAPSMSGFASDLRLPLPMDIDAGGKGVVNKEVIRELASGFDPAWAPLLGQPAAAPAAAPGAADLHQTVADFLVANVTADARGSALAARARTNALDARPFVLEAFSQMAAGKFDAALAFMNSLVNPDVSLLASQRDGAAIIDGIRGAISAPPTPLSEAQQTSLSRANLMLGSVAASVPRAPPAARTTSIKDVDLTRYAGGGDVNAWITQACQAAGVPANSSWVNGLLTLSQRESTNDPNSVNDTDVNATGAIVADGHKQNCSRGVAQVTPSTFMTFHADGTSWSIYDPVANIAAAIGYVRNRYHVSLDGSNLATNVRQADPARTAGGY